MNKKTKKDSKKKPSLYKVLSSFIAVVIVLLAVWLIISYSAAIKITDPTNERLTTDPAEAGIAQWDTIEVVSGNNYLRGWYMPASGDIETPSDKVVIISHNYESNRAMPKIGGIYLYAELLNNGYDVFAFDYAGCGESDGRFYSFGSNETKQLNDVINYVHEINQSADIAVIGWAFGGAAAICAGCENENVSVIISDSSYTDLPEYFAENMSLWSKLPGWLFDKIVTSMAEGLAKADYKTASPVKSVENCEGKSFLFIHGDKDTVINPAASTELANKASVNNYVEQWTITDCRHLDGFIEQEDNYTNNILTFLNNHIS